MTNYSCGADEDGDAKTSIITNTIIMIVARHKTTSPAAISNRIQHLHHNENQQQQQPQLKLILALLRLFSIIVASAPSSLAAAPISNQEEKCKY